MARLSFFSKITVELSNAEGFFELIELINVKCDKPACHISRYDHRLYEALCFILSFKMREFHFANFNQNDEGGYFFLKKKMTAQNLFLLLLIIYIVMSGSKMDSKCDVN